MLLHPKLLERGTRTVQEKPYCGGVSAEHILGLLKWKVFSSLLIVRLVAKSKLKFRILLPELLHRSL